MNRMIGNQRMRALWYGAAACAAMLGATIASDCSAASGAEGSFSSTPVVRRTIYHSPQTPGYTCWVGAWLMPDGHVQTGHRPPNGTAAGFESQK